MTTDLAAPEVTQRSRRRTVSVPRVTRIGALAVVLGILVQATLAGGFLAGRTVLRDLHGYVGNSLLVVGAVVLLAGLVGRRSTPESAAELGTRAGLLLALAVAVFAGMRASRGSADLLMLHIPVAFTVMGLASRLFMVSSPRRRRSGRDRTVVRPAGTVATSPADRLSRGARFVGWRSARVPPRVDEPRRSEST